MHLEIKITKQQYAVKFSESIVGDQKIDRSIAPIWSSSRVLPLVAVLATSVSLTSPAQAG